MTDRLRTSALFANLSNMTLQTISKRYRLHTLLLLLLTVSGATLLSCGGGGGDEGSTSNSSEQETSTPPPEIKRIVFFGDSLTEGYSLPRNEAFPALIQEKINAESLPFDTVNAGVSGDTTEDGLNRIDAQLSRPISVFVETLGVNDAEDGLPASTAERNLQAIFDRVKAVNPAVTLVVAGVNHPRIMSNAQAQEYGAMFARLAEKNNAFLIPNFMEGVAGVSSLSLPDRIHPNAAGHQQIAENMWIALRENVLLPLLQ